MLDKRRGRDRIPRVEEGANMIDTSSLGKSSGVTKVEASDKIFIELGKNTYDYKDLVSELIDNAIAARGRDRLLEVSIQIHVDDTNKPVLFVIRDNADGISKKRLGSAITPAGVQSENSLNEHGLGMKQAVAALGDLKYLATKTKGEKRGRLVKEFKFGDIPTYGCDFAGESGTEIVIENLTPLAVSRSQTHLISRDVVPYLGARYRRFLRPDNCMAKITISVVRVGTNEVRQKLEIREEKPVYFHPATRRNEPVILRYPLSGDGWKAMLTFGRAPKSNAEHEELGVEPPNKFHPYRVSLNKQGLDVIRHDRIILFHQLSEIGIVNARHPDFNNVRGEIDLIRGFSTAITKNSIIEDEHFRGCIATVRGILEGESPGPGNRKNDYLKRATYPEQIPERLLRDRLAAHLKTNPMGAKQDVKTEYAVDGIEGKIDILADGEAWEIKTEQAMALDVYQLFMYIDVGNIEQGYLVAKGFSTGAKVAVDHIKEKHAKTIVLATHEQFPITGAPSASEREEYY